MKLVKVLSAAAVMIVYAHAGIITTYQSASSQVDANGTTQVQNDQAVNDGFASSQAIWPAGNNIPQARTAARSSIEEIAANARVYSPSFAQFNIDLALSQAVYAIDLPVSPFPTPGAIDFFLPPSYIEIQSNAELAFNVLNAVFFADLRVCHALACGLSDRVFYFQVNAEGSFRNNTHSIILNGDPALDLSSLQNPTVSTTSDGFLKTYLVEFPTFSGHLDLGFIPADTPLRVEYLLQARAWGPVGFSSAIAAINDPFTLNTDPVQPGVGFVFTSGPPLTSGVPEPWSGALAGSAILFLAAVRRRAK